MRNIQMRFLLLAVLCMFSGTAHATTYNVDINSPWILGLTVGPTGQASTNACSPATCAGGFNTAYSFSAQPGDILNFGTLSLSSVVFGDGRQARIFQYVDANGQLQSGFGTPIALYAGALGVTDHYTPFLTLQTNISFSSMCTTADPSCFPRLSSLVGFAEPIDLTFTLPDSGFIELGWTRPFIYTPPAYVGVVPVPEPSTWAMMLLGFAGIGFMTWRKSLMVKRDNGSPLRRRSRDVNIRV
jgi:hypothetical protein